MRRLLRSIGLNYAFNFFIKRRSSGGVHTILIENDNDCIGIVGRMPTDHIIRVYLEDKRPDWDGYHVVYCQNGNAPNEVNEDGQNRSQHDGNGNDDGGNGKEDGVVA